MGFTSIMSSNRFGSPRFPNEGSVFNFNNINEIQDPFIYHLGKPPPPPPPPPSNMNVFDEYLKSLVTTTTTTMDDEKLNQKFMVRNNASTSSSSSSPQSSASVNLNRTLSNNGVHEVWNEIIIQRNQGNVVDEIKDDSILRAQVLEDYLMGQNGDINTVINNQNISVNPQPLVDIDPMVAVSQQQPDWLKFPMAHQMGVMGCLPVSGSLFGNHGVVDVGYTDNQLSLSVPMPMNGTPSAEKKRLFSDEMMEKTIERRQKRMLKNRESAARSRARKQQYTNDLELKVVALQRMNKRLMKEKEFLLQMQEMLLQKTDPKLCPKYQLRRSHSALF